MNLLNSSFKRIYAYESLVGRRLFGAFDILAGKRQRFLKAKSDHRDRMRFLKRQKKMNTEYTSKAQEEPGIDFLTPQK